ncbi:substrate-binding domain-containing protein [Alkalimarinus coralli]|uniref:substrate-binding domain-containing protein n=1 Tax=Alkalimarinus coralli TaxID=2935863 RepID=UPI00202B5CB8|nr:substrate-binding domain-containing protein [Alkalimarinus coralli]
MLVNLRPQRFIILLLIPLLFSSHLTANQNTDSLTSFANELPDREYLFEIHGSNTIGAVLAPNMVSAYLKNKGVCNILISTTDIVNETVVEGTILNSSRKAKVRIAAHGSSTGFKSLLNGSGQIAAASRAIKAKEINKLKQFGDMTSVRNEHIVGIDGLAVITHASNPIKQLTKQTIAKVFSGKIRNWNQLGGPDQTITLYARDDKSGTWDTFKQLVLGKGLPLHSAAQRFESNDELARSVSNDPSGIGFTGIASTNNTNIIAISDGESRALMPTKLNIATEDYPLARRLYMYTKSDMTNPFAKEFIKFSETYDGQQVVTETGFVSQNITTSIPEDDATIPSSFKQLVEGYQRLSVNFRFSEGRTKLDNKAERDLDRLIYFMDSNNIPNEDIMLIGYSDKQSNELRAQLISELRALSVKTAIKRRGKTIRAYTGYGQYMPLATTSGDKGVFKNGRVEVWARL